MHDRRLAADEDGGALFLADPQRLGHDIDAVHAAIALGVVDSQRLGLGVPLHAAGGAQGHHFLANVQAAVCVARHLDRIDPDVVTPGADDGNVGPGHGSHAVVGAAGNLHLRLVGEHRAVELILVRHRDVVQQLQRVDARILAAARTHAAARGAHVRARTTQVEADLREIIETRLQPGSRHAQQNDVAGGAVHVGQAAAMFVPDIAQLAQLLGVVKPTRRHVDAHRVELCHRRKFLRQVGVPPDHAAAVAANAHDAAMFPVPDAVNIGPFELTQQVFGRVVVFGRPLHLGDETGPGPLLELIEQRGFGRLAGDRLCGIPQGVLNLIEQRGFRWWQFRLFCHECLLGIDTEMWGCGRRLHESDAGRGNPCGCPSATRRHPHPHTSTLTGWSGTTSRR